MIQADDETEGRYDPEAEEGRQYADYQEVLKDTEIVGCVTVEPTYAEDDYIHFPHTHPRFDVIRIGWPGPNNPMPHKKAEEEQVYMTGSDSNDNTHGFNMNPEKIYPEVAREIARRPTCTAPGNNTNVSLGVVVRRVALLLNKPEGYVQPVLHTLNLICICSCDTLDSTLSRTLND